jgi:putative peptide zinc metalloprotease protein
MTQAASVPSVAPQPLPQLRADLQIEFMSDGGGFPTVIVTDPVRSSYFKLGWPESGILLLWRDAATVEDLSRSLSETFGLSASAKDIASVAEFAFANQLTETDPKGTWHRYASIRSSGQHGVLKSLMHNYLFFRWPLIHPEPGLHWLLPRLSFVFSRTFWGVLVCVALGSIYLATRQWADLEAAAAAVLRLEGLAVYGFAVLALKLIHELGHALTTVRYGCRVPSMGIAVMLGTPVFYTDTSDSWRLADRSKRLAIVFAGVSAEMIVATVAILLWSFLPDGLARDLAFAFATTSITLSIAINLNPFMRYDGYFALSDYLKVPNLQSRAFDLALWKLREKLFNLDHPPPELFSPDMQRKLIVYAVLTAIYRFFLYLGIVVIVYLMAGKAVGIVLGLFELVVFILNPIMREVMVWWKLRAEIAARQRSWKTAAIGATALVVGCVPWISTVRAPAVLVANEEQAIYLPFASRLTGIHVSNQQVVKAGDVLFAAQAHDLERQYGKAVLEVRALEFEAARLHASDQAREGSIVIASRLARAREAVAALKQQQQQLVIRAPFSGKIVDLDPEIAEGLWLNEKYPLARLISTDAARIKGLLGDVDVERIVSGGSATFFADDAAVPQQSAHVATIATSSDGRLAELILADIHGGGVGASDRQGKMMTHAGWFEVNLTTRETAPTQLVRGVVHIEARAVSPIALAWRRVVRVLVREHGF